jgi:hypothetical protein
MTTTLPNLDAESFGMHDHFLPGAPAGSYKLQINARMNARDTGETFHHEENSLEFIVDAPRFSLLAREEIRACSPPHGENVEDLNTLPHIVLNHRSLPWERTLRPQTNETSPLPWMALILLTQDEIQADGARVIDILGREISQNGGPSLDIDSAESESTIKVIDISATLFRAVCPNFDDLPLLAHVRRVNMDDKSSGPAGQSSDFAILTSNRFVQQGTNFVFLISLEGWSDWLSEKNGATNNGRMRIVILHSWNFTSATEGTSFATCVKKLNVDVFADNASRATCPDPALQSLLDRGYMALAYQPDGAEKTAAWYRGPCSPVAEASFGADDLPFDSADTAMTLDENTGMLDISYSAAFQLGRLLALGSPSFGAALRRWNHNKQLDLLSSGDQTSPPQTLLDEMAQYLVSHVLAKKQEDASLTDIGTVSNWFVQLRQLQMVPFRYLVPGPGFLPPESLRLFYLDENWLDALTDGAFSLSAATSTGPWFARSTRGMLRQTVRRLLAAQRVAMGRLALDENTRLAGFLLRSKLLGIFPGLEIECFETNASSTPPQSRKLDLVRMDHLDSDLLLVLVAGVPDQIRFRLPRESLTYSHDAVGLRPRITRAEHGDIGARNPNIAPIVIKDYIRPNPFVGGVLDIRKLQDMLEGPNDTSSARFALHWLNGPDDVTICWEHAQEGSSS